MEERLWRNSYYVENEEDGEVDCPEVWDPISPLLKKRLQQQGLKIIKAAGHTDVASEMMKASGGLGTRWMTDRNNNIVEDGCILYDWRKITMLLLCREKCKAMEMNH